METTTLDFTTTVDPETAMDVDPPIPMACTACGRPALYDYGDDKYHHADDPAVGCFAIPAEADYPAHPEHPLVAQQRQSCCNCLATVGTLVDGSKPRPYTTERIEADDRPVRVWHRCTDTVGCDARRAARSADR